ncbi:serine hydrolase [Dactylosporangium sucinum]|uniref:serine hydrolase n=1 Tax=Dactylosporangium sucinum TaxID=1424081 RepID=UPI00167D84D1|nr:serine hydrolase [Dactylosporangium sucinum]
MSVRRGVVALLTLLTLVGCGDKTPTQATPNQAGPQVSDAGSETSALGQASVQASVQPSASGATPGQSRQQQAKAFIEQQPGTIGIVVRDRTTGQVWKAGNTTATTWTASTIKLAIAADLLERQRAGQLRLDQTDKANLDKALVNSDNDAATALWNRYDGAGMLERFRSRFGMRSLAVVQGYDTFWRNLRCSADDLQNLMTYVLEKLAPEDQAYLVATLRKVASNQRWGVWAAGSALKPGNKDGWAQKPVNGRTVWVTHTVGFAGDGERYVVAAMYEQGASGTLAKGAHALSDAVALYFGAKVPAPVTLP